MTDFDLGDPAPDADEEPDPESNDDQDTSESAQSVDETPATESEPESESDRSASRHDSDPEPDESSSDDGDEPDPTETGPAFPYSEVDQNPLYAREKTWHEFNLAIDTELVPALRDEGIMDDELREIHDIVLEIALDNLDEVPERLKEKRRNL